MCGICGIVDPAGVDRRLLQQMTDAIAHRGPDAEGTWISPEGTLGLGHRRLTIIDLDPRSNQPFFSDDGQVVLVFNGEIYNYRDIRRELEGKGYRFRTESDTEVIVQAYMEWGLECVHKLRDMFAFALFDRRLNRLWIVRDRLGIKPLNYYHKDGVLAFASKIQPLSQNTPFDTELDVTALYDCLTYLYIPAPKTAFKHIRKLEAGHYLLMENGNVSVRRYWDVPSFGENVIDEKTAISRLREICDEAVRFRMVADVPVGSLLSGGIDSSTVTWYAQKNATGPLNTFSVGFDVASNNELTYAAALAAAVGSNHHTHVYSVAEAQRFADHSMNLYGEPHGDSSIFPTTVVSAMARERVTVALSGDGGDEVFWGYKHYLAYAAFNRRFAFPMRSTVRQLLLKAVPFETRGRHRLLRYCLDDFDLYTVLMGGFNRSEKELLLDPGVMAEFRDYDDYWAYRRYWREDLPVGTRLQYLDLKTYLPDDILTKVDRASMSVGLEARAPLVDHELIEEVFSWPESVRSDGKTLKYIFKKAMRGVLPDVILDKPKQGFSIPWRTWIKKWKDLNSLRGDGSFFRKALVLPSTYTILVMQQWLDTFVNN